MKGMLYQYFCDLPIWAMALMLYFFVIGILFVIRDWREKLPYNVSVASQQGDWALIGIILMGVEIAKGQQDLLVPWLESRNNQVIWLVISIIIGIIYQWVALATRKQPETAADTYRNLFVVPLLVFMLGATAPVIFIYGEYYKKVVAIALGWVWFLTLMFDIANGRLQQRKWIGNNIDRIIDEFAPERHPPVFFGNSGRRSSLIADKRK